MKSPSTYWLFCGWLMPCAHLMRHASRVALNSILMLTLHLMGGPLLGIGGQAHAEVSTLNVDIPKTQTGGFRFSDGDCTNADTRAHHYRIYKLSVSVTGTYDYTDVADDLDMSVGIFPAGQFDVNHPEKNCLATADDNGTFALTGGAEYTLVVLPYASTTTTKGRGGAGPFTLDGPGAATLTPIPLEMLATTAGACDGSATTIQTGLQSISGASLQDRTPVASSGPNLMINGDFTPQGGLVAGEYYGLVGNTELIPATYAALPGWATEGGLNTPGWLTYAIWGDLYSVRTPGSFTAAAPSGADMSMIYFGDYPNWTWSDSATTSVPPFTWNIDGFQQRESLTIWYFSKSQESDYANPVKVHQTVNGLTVGTKYRLQFWASGEENYGTDWYDPGVAAVEITGYNRTFFSVPANGSGAPNTPVGHRYTLDFVATSSSTTIAFLSWGHVDINVISGESNHNATELTLDDVILTECKTSGLPTITAVDDSYMTPYNTAMTTGNASTGDSSSIGMTDVTYTQTGSGPSNGAVSAWNSATGTFTYTPNDGYSGTDSFTYKVCLPDPNTAICDEATETITIELPSDVTIALSGFPSTAAPNAAVNGVVTCTNNSSVAAIGVFCGVTGANTVDDCKINGTGSVVSLPLASLAAGSNVVCNVSANMPASGDLVLDATTSATNESNTGNNMDSVTVTPTGSTPLSDMTTALSGFPSTSAPNAPVAGLVTCTNGGPAAATSVTCAVATANVNNCKVNGTGSVVSLPLASLAAGDNITCDVSATMPASGDLVLDATTSATNESNTGNNTDSMTVTPTAPPPPLGQAEILVDLTFPSSAKAGATVTGSVTCTNSAGVAAINATCWVSPNATLSNCRQNPDATPLTIPVSVPSLPVGSSIACTVTAQMPQSGSLQVTAYTDADNDEQEPNNMDPAVITVVGGGGSNAQPPQPIPTLTDWAIFLMTFMMIFVAGRHHRRMPRH